jgi:hypothetical protein
VVTYTLYVKRQLSGFTARRVIWLGTFSGVLVYSGMNPKPIAFVIVGALCGQDIVHHDHDKLPHPKHAPAPVLIPKPITVVTSAERLPRNAKELFARFVTQPSSGKVFPLV